METSARKEMLAQVAMNYGDTINAQKILEKETSFSDSVKILSQSARYGEILPLALGAYTADGNEIGNVISSFKEFEERSMVARELTELLESRKYNPLEAAKNLARERAKLDEQLGKARAIRNYTRIQATKLVILNAMFNQHEISDRFFQAKDKEHLIGTLETLVDNFDSEKTLQIKDEVFDLYEKLENKYDIEILKPGLEANDIELVRALSLFAKAYSAIETKKWRFGLPKFREPNKYKWQGNTFADTVRRLEKLYETGRLSFVSYVIDKIDSCKTYFFDDDSISESPKLVLEAAERLKDANLPEEVYIALGTEFREVNLIKFADNILQEQVISKIRKLDKMGANFAKAAIAYTACYESAEDVKYVAENIMKVERLGKARQIFKAVMNAGRCKHGAERLKAFLPEGINLNRLPKPARDAIRQIGLSVHQGNIPLVHDVLRENLDKLKEMKTPVYNPPYLYRSHCDFKIKDAYEAWLGFA